MQQFQLLLLERKVNLVCKKVIFKMQLVGKLIKEIFSID